jgi:hypothetical protein
VIVLRDVRVVGLPLLLTTLVVAWAAVTVSERSWLYAVVLAAVGVADLPVVARVRQERGTALALLIHAGFVVVGWFLAFAVWAPFAHWE